MELTRCWKSWGTLLTDAGLEQNDTIRAINGEPTDDVRSLFGAIQNAKSFGQPAEVIVIDNRTGYYVVLDIPF